MIVVKSVKNEKRLDIAGFCLLKALCIRLMEGVICGGLRKFTRLPERWGCPDPQQ
jgi:hypothetical protein